MAAARMTTRSLEIRLRSLVPDDEAFLFQVYASTRIEELAVTGWDAAQTRAFLAQQFAAQHQHYQTYYADAQFSVVLDGDTPVGRLYVARWEREIRIVDIALLPEHRSRGIGTWLLQQIMAEGVASGKPVSIHVERFNPALGLYERLGFRETEDKGVYALLTWTPGAS
jgi:ribosomal protein S18 acetylase RimI-like enzyme